MPKHRRGRTTRGVDRSMDPLSSKIPDLKKKVCTMIFELIRKGGRVDIILNYLKMIQRDKGIDESKIPSLDEISGDLISGLRELIKFNEELIGTPLLNESEQNNIYLTSEEAKIIQLKKDGWLQRFTKSEDIMEWLTDDSIKNMFELTGDIPITPRPREKSEDQWEDISILFNNTIAYLRSREEEEGVTELLRKFPTDIPLTHISINVGKINDYQSFIIEMGETLLKKSSNLAINLTSLLGKLGLVTLKIGGYTMALTTTFISDLFLNILQNNINTGLLNIIGNILGGLFGSTFVISNDSEDIKNKIFLKYKYFLCLIIIKTIFMLGHLIFKANDDTVDTPHKLRESLNYGIELLNSYITDKNYNSLDFVSEEYRDIRRQIDDIMVGGMDKLTEWYLMRKTIVFDINRNKILSLEDKKDYRSMEPEEIERMLGSEMSLEPEPEDGVAAKRKGKKSKRKRKSSKKKKKKKLTKRRKKK